MPPSPTRVIIEFKEGSFCVEVRGEMPTRVGDNFIWLK